MNQQKIKYEVKSLDDLQKLKNSLREQKYLMYLSEDISGGHVYLTFVEITLFEYHETES